MGIGMSLADAATGAAIRNPKAAAGLRAAARAAASSVIGDCQVPASCWRAPRVMAARSNLHDCGFRRLTTTLADPKAMIKFETRWLPAVSMVSMYSLGERVEVRDSPTQDWVPGVVTLLNPFQVRGHKWNEIRKTTE